MIRNNRGNILRAVGMVLPLIAATTMVNGETTMTGPTISGYVDTQYGYNFNKPASETTTLRSYDAQNNNIANTAHVSLAGSFGEGIGYVVDLDAGHDANVTVGGASGSAVVLQEGYLTYKCPITHLGIKAGKFATFEGIEVIETNANPTISRGYLYGLAEPFTHVGGVLSYAMGKFDVAAGVVNGWDVPNDNNPGKTLVGKIGLNFGDPLSVTISGLSGPEQNQSTVNGIVDGKSGNIRDSADITILTKIIPKTDLYLQANAGSERNAGDFDGGGLQDDRASWSGAGIQPLVHFTDKFTVGARLEYFSDPQGYRNNAAGGVSTLIKDTCETNFTITPGYKLTDNIQVRAEYRYDTSNKKLWVDDKGVAKDSASTGALQFLVTF